jgi:Transcription factor WhiB
VAREVCASCRVRLACLAYTLRTRPAPGVWAGFTPDEIAALIAAKRPVRPRRHTALRPASAEPARIAEVA